MAAALIGAASAEEAAPAAKNSPGEELLAPEELPDVQEDFLLLYEKNPDVIGWLTAGETIDLPVVQRDNEFYLSHNYFGEWTATAPCFSMKETCFIRGTAFCWFMDIT